MSLLLAIIIITSWLIIFLLALFMYTKEIIVNIITEIKRYGLSFVIKNCMGQLFLYIIAILIFFFIIQSIFWSIEVLKKVL
jgi:hypothetical protein